MEIVSIFFFYNKKKLFHNRRLYCVNRIVERTDKEINIYYTKLIKVIIKYIDMYTGEEIIEGEELELQAGQNYNIKNKAKHIDNYRLVQKPSETGTVMQEDFEAIYYYSKKSSVTIKVVDIETGEVIKTINITGYSGDNYGIDIPVIDGYECQEDTKRISGIITNDAKIITLHYKGKKQNNNPPEEENIDISDDEEYPEEEVELENEDATTAKTILPQTGETSAIIVIIVVCITSFGIFAFIKQRED